MDEQEAKALREENATLKAEMARLRERDLLREAREIVASELAKVSNLPELTRARLTESLSARPAVKDGEIDRTAYGQAIQEAAKAELAYLAGVTGGGRITGMGSTAPAGDDADAHARVLAGFVEVFRRQGETPERAKELAELAARG